MADWAERSVSVRPISWKAGPGEALAYAVSQGGLGWVKCVLSYIFIPVLPTPLPLTCQNVVGITGGSWPVLPKLSSFF